jgi:hypothetical protein
LHANRKSGHPLYEEFAATAPEVGSEVGTPDGDGRVIGHDVPGEKLVVRMAADGRVSRCALASVCGSRKAYESRHEPEASPETTP